jgi:carbon monoxide dehydrogenase subunit G
MDMTGSQPIEASREAVYAGLNDVNVLQQCIPGCESIEKTSDTEMNAKVTLRIGPMKASFTGKVTLSDLDPPNGYTISGEGSGGVAGFANGGAKVRLEAAGAATILHYTVTANIGGKLAQLGSRLIDGTAKKLAGDFFEKFGATFSAPAPVDPTAEAPKKAWFGRLIGTASAALFAVVLSGNPCCVNGVHNMDDIVLMSPLCKAPPSRV